MQHVLLLIFTVQYTEDAGLPYFDHAAVTAKGYW